MTEFASLCLVMLDKQKLRDPKAYLNKSQKLNDVLR